MEIADLLIEELLKNNPRIKEKLEQQIIKALEDDKIVEEIKEKIIDSLDYAFEDINLVDMIAPVIEEHIQAVVKASFKVDYKTVKK